jgi:hypothetical protein
MNQRLLPALCVVLLLGLTACESPTPRAVAARDVASMELTARQRSAFAVIFTAYRGLLFRKAQECEMSCDVTITLQMVTVTLDDGAKKDFCVATLPESIEFKNTLPDNLDKTITWKLNASTVGGMPVEFHEDHGILVLDGDKNEFKPFNKRTDKITFKATNRHKVKNASATYVPLIIRYNNGLPEVCGTADPKMINT